MKALAVDGSAIDAILDLAGAPKKSAPSTKLVSELEAALGKPLATETKKFLERPVTLTKHPDANVSVSIFLARSPTCRNGSTSSQTGARVFFSRVQHFLGPSIRSARPSQYGDTMIALVVLEPYTKNGALGGVMYYRRARGRHVGNASISAVLSRAVPRENIAKRQPMADSEPRDCFVFEKHDTKKPLPSAAKIPPAIAKAWDAHWRWRLERAPRWWIGQFLRGVS